MHEPVAEVGAWLGRVLTRFYQYHAVPGSGRLCNDSESAWGHWRRVLERRSQRGRLTAERIARYFQRWLPRPGLAHPYSDTRFDATHPR